ncbi:MAG: endonuclease Q family protein [Candidatus Pacebacteria bacterium]|nr:endonuclease Q family protein [Candidatus Paceibacterota bacterium]MDD3919032.1 endonuclease Q family protein [Candidatus Paceibacterota bacterium]
MKIIADFHIHSKYSRAVSPKMNLIDLGRQGEVKGINIIGTGDFTHPLWFSELKEKLTLDSSNFYTLKGVDCQTKFVVTGEVSLIYSKKGRVRKIHLVLICPNLEVAEKINQKLSLDYNLKADGRPILKLDAKEFLKIVLDVSKDVLVVPAHIMTPWFGLYGSKSGFDSIKDCFEDLSDHIYAYETGLSANPTMLLRMKECRERTLLSNSDAHSLEKLGREANIFDCDFNYNSIIQKIKNNEVQTIEFYPEEGKYFNDGHRKCEVNLSPEETYKYNGRCPVCTKPLLVGVLNRVNELSDVEKVLKSNFKSIVPLKEILSEVLNIGISSKTLEKEYLKLIKEFKTEFNILLFEELSNIEKINQSVAFAIKRVREGNIGIVPGYDGKFGEIRVFEDKEDKKQFPQDTLF